MGEKVGNLACSLVIRVREYMVVLVDKIYLTPFYHLVEAFAVGVRHNAVCRYRARLSHR